ncbi:ubiquitin-like modifier 1 [Stereum hirsutum FP-91666 SS1]|uniref:ubiquitin-like modifier 1 n=1 Tax=Stereum hirsutum (strain FP-91666) TaxID=721885 RepID=UPI000440C425|nr:ubiquitin-like modifier 1 [Stereum hirsutum FP-91666 SS1]EIM87548.1 ubiquitin-like modifier 1 [Stereum hirsutum FP-91666 SS1]
MSTINVKIEFGGGLELLFSNQRSHRVSIPSHVPAPTAASDSTDAETTPSTRPSDITYLISWLKDNLLQERAELFIENGTVRPGILVLVNDTDWELEGEGDYQLKDGDEVVFISTLHGG